MSETLNCPKCDTDVMISSGYRRIGLMKPSPGERERQTGLPERASMQVRKRLAKPER